MKKLLFLLFLFIHCNYKDEIIRIPKETQKDIPTKNGLINYYFFTRYCKAIEFEGRTPCSTYKIENMKNLNLFVPENLNRNFLTEISGEKNDILSLSFDSYAGKELDSENRIICELFYQTKYIDKKIFSISNNLENKSYKYFGGTPQNLIENLNQFTFFTNDSISEIELISNDKKNHKIKINSTMNNKIEFNDDDYMVCFSHDIFSELKNILFNHYRDTFFFIYKTKYIQYQIFDLDEEQKKNFPEIKIKIGNKIISLNKNDLIREDNYIDLKGYDDLHNYLFIKSSPCDNNIFGLKFLEKFEMREYNLETKEINLYLSKNKSLIKNENSNSLALNSYGINLTFISLYFLVIIFIIMLSIRNSHNNKYYQYFISYHYNM